MPLKSISMRRPPPPPPPPPGLRGGVWARATDPMSARSVVAANATRGLMCSSDVNLDCGPPEGTATGRRSLSRAPRPSRPPLERLTPQQLEVDPHRIHVRPHSHPLVRAMDAPQVVPADPDADEAQHVGCERRVAPRVCGADHEPRRYYGAGRHRADGACQQPERRRVRA